MRDKRVALKIRAEMTLGKAAGICPSSAGGEGRRYFHFVHVLRGIRKI